MFKRTFHHHFMVECIIFLLLFNLIVLTNESRRKLTKNRTKISSTYNENKQIFKFLNNSPSNEKTSIKLFANKPKDKSIEFRTKLSQNGSSKSTDPNKSDEKKLTQNQTNSKNLVNFKGCRSECKSVNRLENNLVFYFLNLTKTGNGSNKKLLFNDCFDDCFNKSETFLIKHRKFFKSPQMNENSSTKNAQSVLFQNLFETSRSKRQISHPNLNSTNLVLNSKNGSSFKINQVLKLNNSIKNETNNQKSNDYQFVHQSKQNKEKKRNLFLIQNLTKSFKNNSSHLNESEIRFDPDSVLPHDDNFPLPAILKLTNSCRNFSRNHKIVVLCAGEIFTDVPKIVRTVNSLTLYQTSIIVLKSNSLSKYVNLTNLYLENNKYLDTIENDAFKHLTQLQSVTIKQAPLLKIVDPAVISNCPSQISLFIYRSGLEKAIKINHNKDKRLVSHLNLDNNKIRKIESFTFKVYVDFMSMDYNLLESIEANAFNESHIGHLSLKGNYRLISISEFAFQNLHTLRILDLSETSIIMLPVQGLSNLETLRMMRTYTLKKFPSVFDLPSIKTAHLTYPYHCCAFKYPRIQDPAAYDGFEKVMKRVCNKNQTITTTTTSSPFGNFGTAWGDPYNKELGIFIPKNGTDYVPREFIKYCGRLAREDTKSIICHPIPDAFNPCEDIMGNYWLRITVWLVLIAALFGNLSVFVILFTGKLPINVSKFLMCNLAIADFVMGVYLLLIAVTDLRTMGEYFNYAIDWQHGLGCKVAGFLTVFSSELSIYTLTVITMERYFPIAYPLQINKRLKLSFAFKIMLAGWLYSLLMAALPLPFFGISSYVTSICLPMQTRNVYDYAYLIFILLFSAVDFVLICACYGKMYLSIISQKTRASHNDMKVAKGMAMLVFTDFACFMPVTFFGLTAISGYPLIDVTHSKILLVFFFPLNALCNPFLYTILTKQLRRDFYLLASRFGLCTSKAFRPTPCTHLAYYRYYHRHRHNAKCLATIGSAATSKSSSNCQSMLPGYSNATNTSNSYSASASQLSNSIHDDSCMNNRCSLENSKRHGRILRYYYRNPYPHHHFSFSKQYKETGPSMEPCCNKYKRKEHEKHVHCYHHHHHKKHPHSAPVSQANESFSIGIESNSENSASKSAAKINLLDPNYKYSNNALSTSLLYTNNNPNISSCSSSNDYCSLTKGTHHLGKCTTDSNKVGCPNCSTNKKSMIKYLTHFKSNYLFHNNQEHLHNNDLHNRPNSHHPNEIGSLTTGTTYDSTFTTNNNPTALTQLSTDSNILNNHIEIKKLEKLTELDKKLNFSTTITQEATVQCEKDKKVDLLTTDNNEQIVVVGSYSKQTKSFKNLLGNKIKSNKETNKKEAKKSKPIKFKFKLTTSKQNKTNEIELKKLKNKTINDQEQETKLLKPRKTDSTVRLEINQTNSKQQLPVLKENVLLKTKSSSKDGNLKRIDDLTERTVSNELINHQNEQTNKVTKEDQKTKSSILDDLMDNQVRTKPKILKKWITSSRKKRDYNCHTNFKLIKNDIQLDGQQDACQSILESNELNKISLLKENDEQIKKKHSLLLGKTGYNKETLFRLFRSLTSSSSTNTSNPSGNTSDSMQNSASNGCLNTSNTACLNDKLNVTKNMNLNNNEPNTLLNDPILEPTNEGKSSPKLNKSFDIKEFNLSLNSLETSPQKLKN